MAHALFGPEADRFVLFPILLPEVWEEYKKQQASFWTVEEVDLSQDVVDWANKLKTTERDFIKMVLAFFAASDGIVGENLVVNFMAAFSAPEVRCVYGFQTMMENVHSEMYSLLIDALITDASEKQRLLNAVQHYDCVAAKADWALRWMRDGSSLGQKLVAFAAVEGIFFSCSFCAIFWLRKRGVMPGLCNSNEFISRDEGMHTQFACLLVNMLPESCDCACAAGCCGADACSGCTCGCGQRLRPSADVIRAIITDAVDTERQFVRDALKVDLLGINAGLMEQYLECVADNLLHGLGVEPVYGTPNPFEWMHMVSLEGKTNFFERRVSEYRRATSRNAATSPVAEVATQEPSTAAFGECMDF